MINISAQFVFLGGYMFSFVKNLFKNSCPHDWKEVYEEESYRFLGERCVRLEPRFRICQECGKAQECCYIIGEEPDWEKTLNDCETKVPLSKIKDMGDYYVLIR